MPPVMRFHEDAQTIARPTLQIWGGAEYTCNRVRDCYFDQMELSGHAQRTEDYASFAALGLKTLRVGLLWERHAAEPSWQCEDRHLDCIRQLGMRPIAGLVHHGSGPSTTSLLDPQFPRKLAAYARAVAERYPWIDAYTPVNEPNTTARFSARYGIWYPHEMSVRSYLRALLNQLRGTTLAMHAIRQVNPEAKLVQTEDVGNISGTDALRYTCNLLNLRQWLTFDLLCGRVDRSHAMFSYMRRAGIGEDEIFWFRDNPCPPDVVGLNYYVTSDRYLDHRIDCYPNELRSAEGRFVDVEAVRVSEAGIVGTQTLLTQAWQRYALPLAITEVHLGSSSEEQIRWLVQNWNDALEARRRGANCIAVTAWALLGSFFWNALVTRDNGHYEAGVFDVRSGTPVATELASVLQQVTHGHAPHHPALQQPGWWQQNERICYAPEEELVAS